MSIVPILIALTLGGALVFGYMHEETIVVFEDKVLEKIKKALRRHHTSSAHRKNTYLHYSDRRDKKQ